MLRFRLIDKTKDYLRYEYLPEGKGEPGAVIVNLKNYEMEVERLSPDDEYKIYALKLFSRLREDLRKNEFSETGMVAWY